MINKGAATGEAALPFNLIDSLGEWVTNFVWNDLGSGITDEFLVRLPGATVYTNATISRLFQHGDGSGHYELTAAETATPGKVYYRWLPGQALVIADVVVTFDITDNEVDWTAHGQKTGYGPIRFTTTGGLPDGLAIATDYWMIRRNADSFSLATSRANAISNVAIDMTTAGTGVHTLVDTAATRSILWDYQTLMRWEDVVNVTANAIESGTAQTGTATSITLRAAADASNGRYKNGVILITGGTGALQMRTITGYTGATKVADVDEAWTTNPDASSTYVVLAGDSPYAAGRAALELVNVEDSYKLGDLIRLLTGIFAGKVTNFETGTLAFRSLNDTVTRLTVTTDSTGRVSNTVGTLA